MKWTVDKIASMTTEDFDKALTAFHKYITSETTEYKEIKLLEKYDLTLKQFESWYFEEV